MKRIKVNAVAEVPDVKDADGTIITKKALVNAVKNLGELSGMPVTKDFKQDAIVGKTNNVSIRETDGALIVEAEIDYLELPCYILPVFEFKIGRYKKGQLVDDVRIAGFGCTTNNPTNPNVTKADC